MQPAQSNGYQASISSEYDTPLEGHYYRDRYSFLTTIPHLEVPNPGYLTESYLIDNASTYEHYLYGAYIN